ncbi:MAG: TrkA family potassium uptake protein [Spirochaetes bacterium]|nr:TrkA family potassium uptake protein [Spirochaetota bacterium]
MGKEKVFAVIGIGVFGYAVCKTLSEKGAKVIALDMHEKLINKIKNEVSQTMLLDTSDIDAMTNSGLNVVDVAVVAIGDNIDASILTTANLKEIGIPVVISRAVNVVHAKVLKKVGATEVLFIEEDAGNRLANKLYAPYIINFMPISKNYSIAEINAPKYFENKTIKELELRKKFNLNIFLIQRKEIKIDNTGGHTEVLKEIIPLPDELIMPNDILLIFGNEESIIKIKG